MYMFLLTCVLIFLLYITYAKPTQSEKSSDVLYQTILQLKDEISDCKKGQDKLDHGDQRGSPSLRKSLYSRDSFEISSPTEKRFIDGSNNPLNGPEISYHGGSFTEPGYDAYQNYQKLGYISNETGQYPVYGRQKYPGKSDKLEYYTINEGRNQVKIPFKTTNYNELYDKDIVTVNEFGGDLTFTKYETAGLRYNPNVL